MSLFTPPSKGYFYHFGQFTINTTPDYFVYHIGTLALTASSVLVMHSFVLLADEITFTEKLAVVYLYFQWN